MSTGVRGGREAGVETEVNDKEFVMQNFFTQLFPLYRDKKPISID